MFFDTLCRLISARYIRPQHTTAKWVPIGMIQKTILIRLPHHFAGNQCCWDLLVEPLMYKYKPQLYQTGGETHWASCFPSTARTYQIRLTDRAADWHQAGTVTKSAPLPLLSRLSKMRYKAKKRMKAAEQRYKEHQDAQVRKRCFSAWIDLFTLTVHSGQHTMQIKWPWNYFVRT